jgi:hypothetical protein
MVDLIVSAKSAAVLFKIVMELDLVTCTLNCSSANGQSAAKHGKLMLCHVHLRKETVPKRFKISSQSMTVFGINLLDMFPMVWPTNCAQPIFCRNAHAWQ